MVSEVALIILIYILTIFVLLLSWRAEKYYDLWRREVEQKRRMNIGGDVNFTSYYEDNNDCNNSDYSNSPCRRARKGGNPHASH